MGAVVSVNPYYDTATRQRAGSSTDRYGNTIDDWTSPATLDFACAIQPAATTENIIDRDTVVTRWRLHCAADTDITPLDRVSWRGRTLAVDGDLELHLLKGTPDHLEAFLVGATG